MESGKNETTGVPSSVRSIRFDDLEPTCCGNDFSLIHGACPDWMESAALSGPRTLLQKQENASDEAA